MRTLKTSTRTLLLCAALPVAVAAQHHHDAESRAQSEQRRESWQKVPAIFEAMGIGPGAVVADIGAGSGFFTVRLARAVGASGRVYAVDIAARVVEELKSRVVQEQLTNVEVIEGAADDPHLPAGALDAALIVNSYHEMTEYKAILAKLKAALKPTGRLVIVEPISDSRRDATRERQTESHEIGAQYVQDEARQAGFRVARLEDPFARRHDGSNRPGIDEEWLLVLAPAAPTPSAADQPAATAFASTNNAEWKSPELRIGVEEFKALWAKEAVLVLDVRDAESYRRGHLPGAILRTAEELASGGADRLRGETRPIVTYCS